jgi:hypothetical protein
MNNSPARRITAMASRACSLPLGAAALTLALAGCSGGGIFSDAPGVELAVLEPSADAPKASAPAPINQRRQVQSLERLELGAIHEGRMMTAWGHAPESDWYSPRLEVRRDGLPGPDGFIEFDFVAAPPALNGGSQGPVGTIAQRRIRADIPLSRTLTDGAVGVRVFAEGGATAHRF